LPPDSDSSRERYHDGEGEQQNGNDIFAAMLLDAEENGEEISRVQRTGNNCCR